MARLHLPDTEAEKSLAAVLLGFFGVTALIFLLPKTIKFVVRRFLLGILGEIVAVVITGLLTEKVVDLVGHHEPHQANGQPADERKAPPVW